MSMIVGDYLSGCVSSEYLLSIDDTGYLYNFVHLTVKFSLKSDSLSAPRGVTKDRLIHWVVGHVSLPTWALFEGCEWLYFQNESTV
jgi:hypothetical protein